MPLSRGMPVFLLAALLPASSPAKKSGLLNCTPKVGHRSNLWGVFHDEAQ
jgi:hypothetical protein